MRVTSPISSYSGDVLNPHQAGTCLSSTPVILERGMIIEDVSSGFVGEVVRMGKVAGNWQFELEDYEGFRRSFPFGKGYWIEGQPVELLVPREQVKRPATVAGHTVTASGSLHVNARARVARASRIWVEGKHDAELVWKVWGEDLALEGVVIEELRGVDHLLEVVEDFEPTNERRAGILVDHLVPGSKESRIAAEVATMPGVLVLGHPYVDVWQAVKPAVLGLRAWPEVPRGEDIKVGTLRRLGWAAETPEDIGIGWARILGAVRSWKDLEPSLLGPMEELIDFVSDTSAR